MIAVYRQAKPDRALSRSPWTMKVAEDMTQILHSIQSIELA